jgi:hypothetical protein
MVSWQREGPREANKYKSSELSLIVQYAGKRSDRTNREVMQTLHEVQGMLNRHGRRLLRGDESMSSSFDCSFAPARGGKKGLVLVLFLSELKRKG